MEPEREFMGRRKAKLWTYLIFGTLLVLGVLLANFAPPEDRDRLA